MLTSDLKSDREAQMRYFDASCKQLTAGDYVICAATQRKIPIEILRYWSVDLQEAYYDAAASHQRMAALSVEDV